MKKSESQAGRYYTLPDGELAVSVTTILKAIGKPQLIDWAARQERELVVATSIQAFDRAETAWMFEQYLRAALPNERAHKSILTNAGNLGSQVHNLIEWNIRNSFGQALTPQPHLDGPAVYAFAAYEAWRVNTRFEPLLIEQQVWSRTHGYAGTMDVFGNVNGAPVILDWKTSSAIQDEYALQLAAYRHALIEMGHASGRIGGVIVRLPKTQTDQLEVRTWTPEELDEAFEVFLCVRRLHRYLFESKPSTPLAIPPRQPLAGFAFEFTA